MTAFELDLVDNFSRLFEFPVWWARKTEVIEVAKFRFYAPRSEEKPQFVEISDFMLGYSNHRYKMRREKTQDKFCSLKISEWITCVLNEFPF